MSRREYFDRLRTNQPITIDEFRFLRTINQDNSIYSPYRQNTVDFKRDNLTQEDSTVIGSSAALADIRDIGIVSGRFFTDQEEKSRAFVAVIGDDTRINLFPEGSPLGKTFKINGIDFTVIGVQERLGAAFGRQPRQERLHSHYQLQPALRSGHRVRALRARETGHRPHHGAIARSDARGAAHALP